MVTAEKNFDTAASPCHTKSFTTDTTIRAVLHDEKTVICHRAGDIHNVKTICASHEHILLVKYSFLQKSCCDPYKCHKNKKGSQVSGKKSLSVITEAMYQVFTKPVPRVILIGKKLWPMCKRKMFAGEKPSDNTVATYIDVPPPSSATARTHPIRRSGN